VCLEEQKDLKSGITDIKQAQKRFMPWFRRLQLRKKEREKKDKQD
jgi:hypothetical protein